MERFNVGVVGVGQMGANHARIYSSLTHLCNLIGVHDNDAKASQQIAAKYRTTAIASFDELLDQVDAVSVVVPTSAHYEMACKAIERGKHVLLEKPIAATSAEGHELVARARAQGVVLQIGHVERFNPAVTVLPEILANKQIVALEFRRLSPYSPRIFDSDVVSDLMIHDIDVLQSLVPLRPQAVAASGSAPASKVRADYAVATLTYEGGVIANLTASRVTEQKIRMLCITTLEAYIELDYLERRILVTRATIPNFPEDGRSSYRQENIIEKVYVPNHEPLSSELESFLRCIRTGERPLVTGEHGTAALETVERIQTCLYRGT